MEQKESLASQFDRLGYVVIRNLLTSDEVTHYKSKLQQLSGLTDKDFDAAKARLGGWFNTDGVSRLRDWWPLIFHKGLVSAVRETLGPTARYTQHSDLHVHYGTVGWHRDSANRTFAQGPDWDESHAPYKIARVAIYLQPHATSGSALGVIPGSHQEESLLTRLELTAHRRIKIALNRPDLLFPVLSIRPTWIKTEPGDCILFNQRILHTGSHIRGPKYAIFLSYGVDNHHSKNHRRYYLYDRQELKYEDFHPDLAGQLAESNLLLDVKESKAEPVSV